MTSPTARATFEAVVKGCLDAERRDWEERRARWKRTHDGLPQNSEVLAPTPRQRFAERGPVASSLDACVAEYIGDVYGWDAMNDYSNAFGGNLEVLADEVPSWGNQPPGAASQHPLRDFQPSRRAARPKRRDSSYGEVYVIAAANRVKIGFSTCLDRRRHQLQKQSPFELRLIHVFPGTMADEAALHQRFSSCRVRGEWFEPDDDMRAWLDGLAS